MTDGGRRKLERVDGSRGNECARLFRVAGAEGERARASIILSDRGERGPPLRLSKSTCFTVTELPTSVSSLYVVVFVLNKISPQVVANSSAGPQSFHLNEVLLS